jgi:hypothetical protein
MNLIVSSDSFRSPRAFTLSLQVTLIILLAISTTLATNITEEAATNKTKRTIGGQVQNYGENRPVLLYPDNSGAPSSGLNGFYAPVTIKPVFDPEVPKQVAAQQVLYEFQQTPTNAVSNVHVNQFYQPLPQQSKSDNAASPGPAQFNAGPAQFNQGPAQFNAGPAQFISGSESVATPVQHSSLIRHGQNFAQVQFQPLPGAPHHIQTHQYVPGKYLYVNGKIIYQPSPNPNHAFQRPVSFVYNHPQTHTHKYITHPVIRPMPYRRFHPPQPHQVQQITKPIPVPEVNEEQNEEDTAEEDNAQVKEEEVDEAEEGDDKASYEESDDDEDRYFSKYSFNDDDDEDHARYREEEEDEDSERGSSRNVPKKQKKKTAKPQKYSKSNNFKYSENYSASSKFEKPGKKGKKAGKVPKMHYKAVKYSKEGQGKPRIERIEGKQSQNVPIVHKQKIFKEKWYVTKSTDDSTSM